MSCVTGTGSRGARPARPPRYRLRQVPVYPRYRVPCGGKRADRAAQDRGRRGHLWPAQLTDSETGRHGSAGSRPVQSGPYVVASPNGRSPARDVHARPPHFVVGGPPAAARTGRRRYPDPRRAEIYTHENALSRCDVKRQNSFCGISAMCENAALCRMLLVLEG